MQALLNIAIQAARQASDVIWRHVEQVDRIKITPKLDHDFYTEVDVKAEQAIIQTIHKAYPAHGFIAEESGAYQEDADYVWLIDPLDGTKNYIHGFPFYAVSIALSVKNTISCAVIYDPVRHECFSAERGRGARLNSHRLRVSKASQLDQATLGSGLSLRSPLASRYIQNYQSLIGECAGMRTTGSVALDLAYVAAGRLDGFWAYAMKPWDIAAGALIVQESGGLVSNLEGGEDYLRKGDIVAGNPKIHKSLLATLNAAPNEVG